MLTHDHEHTHPNPHLFPNPNSQPNSYPPHIQALAVERSHERSRLALKDKEDSRVKILRAQEDADLMRDRTARQEVALAAARREITDGLAEAARLQEEGEVMAARQFEMEAEADRLRAEIATRDDALAAAGEERAAISAASESVSQLQVRAEG